MEAAIAPERPREHPGPRHRQPLVAWDRRLRTSGTRYPSTVHVETEPGSRKTLCGFEVPDPDDPLDLRVDGGGVYRGADDLDEWDPHRPSCQLCAALQVVAR